MRTSILVLGVAIGIGGASVPASACNTRGEFCGYPGWAANGFSSGDDRVPDYWREGDLAYGYLGPGVSAYGYVPTNGNARVYGYGPAYGYAPAYGSGYVVPGYGYGERRYRRREER